ncbi:hypothetical protein CTI12_AA521650 [Artemisia annua]|uniref:Uncharacterized protein n=1 Tax=Artemisia annua TaxID=35608 RepID=A0A2U1L7H0_ARTAN|nr:hypothetical protein CTI12_AA521650 [Artemisia annua]
MDDENTSTKSTKRISSKNLANKNFHEDQNTSSSSYKSSSFQYASFVSSENVPQPMLVDSPSSTRRVPLTELLNYDPLIENVAPWTFSNTPTMQQTNISALPRLPATNSFSARPTTTSSLNFVARTRGRPPKRDMSIGSSISCTPTQQTSNQRPPLSDLTNALPRTPATISLTATATTPLPVDFVRRPRGRPPKQPTTTTNSPKQTNATLSPLLSGMNPLLTKNTFSAFATPTRSVSQTTLCCNTIGGENISTLSPNSVTKSSDKLTPAASTRKRNCTSTDNSNVTLQTPCATPVNERPTHELKSCSATNRSVLTTQKSTYEVGESSRRPKRSKRPTLQSPTPISFNLDDDVHTTAPSKSKQSLDRNIMNQIKDVLDESSDLVKTFRRAREAYTEDNEQNIKIKLIAKRGKHGRQYDLPTANEVAGLIVGDVDACVEDRDIVLQKRDGPMQRINIFHPMYLALQYPLLMPCAQDGISNV